jgi:hypothetical protein
MVRNGADCTRTHSKMLILWFAGFGYLPTAEADRETRISTEPKARLRSESNGQPRRGQRRDLPLQPSGSEAVRMAEAVGSLLSSAGLILCQIATRSWSRNAGNAVNYLAKRRRYWSIFSYFSPQLLPPDVFNSYLQPAILPPLIPTSNWRSPSISYTSAKFTNASAASPCFLLTSSFNFIHFRKFLQCERSEPLFPNEVLLQFEEVCKNCT